MAQTITLSRLESLTRMLDDTKKIIVYDKHTGYWSWVDKDCVNNLFDYHTGFNSWLNAVLDALEPYLPE